MSDKYILVYNSWGSRELSLNEMSHPRRDYYVVQEQESNMSKSRSFLVLHCTIITLYLGTLL
jgi:hypothetical protein